jgi:hypothetical protein
MISLKRKRKAKTTSEGEGGSSSLNALKPQADNSFVTRKRIILAVIFVCAIVFSYGVYQHYTTFSYNNIIRRINAQQVIPIEDLRRVAKEYPQEAPNVMRAAMANLIQSTADPKEKLALQVQQYWEDTIYIISQPDGTEVIIHQDMSPEVYVEHQSRASQIVARWEKYAPDSAFWRAVKDKRVLRFSRGAQAFSIPYPLLNEFERLYPLPPQANQQQMPPAEQVQPAPVSP